jgi:seryl-tRNA(Sec) selenium transferase
MLEKQPLSGSELKIQEYVARIKAGESKDSILQGLPPSFVSGIEAGMNESEGVYESKAEEIVGAQQEDEINIPPQYKGLDADTLDFIWTIPIYIDPEKTKSEKKRKQKVIDALRKKESKGTEILEKNLADEVKVEQIRKDLGIGSDETLLAKEQELASIQNNEGEENHLISGLVKLVSRGRKQVVIDLYKNLLDNIDDPESRKKLASGLFQDVYNRYRIAEYPIDPVEEQTWENALKSTKVGINNKKSEWMYRGIFPKNGEDTATRGSFNVNVTPELIDSLDEMIASGKIKANYKFGQPGTTASPTERHDSISIYFLEQPSDEALQELAQVIKPYVRGDNLLGRKVEDGFYMSEIGSVETEHIEKFVEELESKDPAFASAVRGYTSPKPGSGTSLKMSEAQYYAVKDVARAFGYTVEYDRNNGFKLS